MIALVVVQLQLVVGNEDARHIKLGAQALFPVGQGDTTSIQQPRTFLAAS